MNNITAEEVTTLTTKLIDKAYKAGQSTALDEVLKIIDKLNHNGSISVKLLKKELKALKGEENGTRK